MRALFKIPFLSPPVFREPEKWSAHLNDFLKQCVQKNVQNRPSAKVLLNHPFLSKNRDKRPLEILILKIQTDKKRSIPEIKVDKLKQAIASHNISQDNTHDNTSKSIIDR